MNGICWAKYYQNWCMGKGSDHKEKGGPQIADTLNSVNESHTVARIISAAKFSVRYRLRLKKQCSINILKQFSTKHIVQRSTTNQMAALQEMKLTLGLL